jgi:hypothetical protein
MWARNQNRIDFWKNGYSFILGLKVEGFRDLVFSTSSSSCCILLCFNILCNFLFILVVFFPMLMLFVFVFKFFPQCRFLILHFHIGMFSRFAHNGFGFGHFFLWWCFLKTNFIHSNARCWCSWCMVFFTFMFVMLIMLFSCWFFDEFIFFFVAVLLSFSWQFWCLLFWPWWPWCSLHQNES